MVVPEFVEFTIDSPERFEALRRIFEELKKDKEADNFRSDEEWKTLFDEEALSHFWWPTEVELADFMKLWNEIPPEKRGSDLRLKVPWDFGSMIDAFKNGEYKLTDCRLVAPKLGRLEFTALAWPYGGTEAMEALIEAFGFQVL